MRIVKVTLDEGAVMPRKGTNGSAAFDICATRSAVIYPDTFESVPTGVRLELSEHCAIISHRSGHNARQGIKIYGLIDPDYRGEVLVSVHNSSQDPFVIRKGDRIAQMRFVEVPDIKLKEVRRLDETERGEGRYGSTGS